MTIDRKKWTVVIIGAGLAFFGTAALARFLFYDWNILRILFVHSR